MKGYHTNVNLMSTKKSTLATKTTTGVTIRGQMQMFGSISDLQKRLEDQHHVADRGLAVSLFLALRLKRPLLRILDATHTLDRESAQRQLYSETFLIKRPLLQAIDPLRTRPVARPRSCTPACRSPS